MEIYSKINQNLYQETTVIVCLYVFILYNYCPAIPCRPVRSLQLLDGRQPERHIRAGRRQHHVLRIELDALRRTRMVAVQRAHLEAGVRVPDVHAAIGAAREDELRVGAERCLDGDALVVEVTCDIE